eukprot:c33739_g1_i1 orf=221-514(+)
MVNDLAELVGPRVGVWLLGEQSSRSFLHIGFLGQTFWKMSLARGFLTQRIPTLSEECERQRFIWNSKVRDSNEHILGECTNVRWASWDVGPAHLVRS